MSLRTCVLSVAVVAFCLAGCHTTSRPAYYYQPQPACATAAAPACPTPCPNGAVPPPPGYVR